MAQHNDFGKMGEQLAQRYLEEQDYVIIECNWRMGHHDVDIIARHDNIVVFVEVKTRSSADFGSPELWVDKKKQRSYIRLANLYVQQHNIDDEVRFDIISIVFNANEHTITHFPNAYTTIG